METRNLADGYFGNEFLAIGNHVRSYGGLKSQDVKKFEKFMRCFRKNDPLR